MDNRPKPWRRQRQLHISLQLWHSIRDNKRFRQLLLLAVLRQLSCSFATMLFVCFVLSLVLVSRTEITLLVLCFPLVCVLCTVCLGPFAHHRGVFGRLSSVSVAIPGHLLYYFHVGKINRNTSPTPSHITDGHLCDTRRVERQADKVNIWLLRRQK